MKEEHFKIDGIPSVLYGDKADKVYIFIHGKLGYKEEAADFAKIVCGKGYQVLGIDLLGHGERKELLTIDFESVKADRGYKNEESKEQK